MKLIKILLISFALFYSGAEAQEHKQKQSLSQASLAQGAYLLNANQILTGIRIKLAPEWKTYWRSPGFFASPLKLDLSEASNIEEYEILWPLPKRFENYGIKTIGYENEVLLPLLITLRDKDLKASFIGQITYYICRDNCIERQEVLSFSWPRNDSSEGIIDTIDEGAIDDYISSVPKPNGADGIFIEELVLGSGERLLIKAVLDTEKEYRDVFIENSENLIEYESIDIDRQQDFLQLKLTFSPQSDIRNMLQDKIRVTLVVSDNQAVEYSGYVDMPPVPIYYYLLLIIMSFLVGLLFNLMPCALPSLSVKMRFLETAPPQRLRYILLSMAAGIILSFMLLSAASYLFEAYIFWYMHLQNPVVLIIFSLPLFYLSYVLSPLFVGVDNAVNNTSDRPDNSGKKICLSNCQTGLLAGVFSSLLATSCSIPFLGSVFALALSGSPKDISIMFLVMGIGFAFPFIIAAYFINFIPSLSSLGLFIRKISYVLSFLAAIGGVWFISSALSIITEIDFLSSVSFILSVIFLLLFFYSSNMRIWKTFRFRRKHIKNMYLTTGFISLFLLIFGIYNLSNDSPSRWQNFDENALFEQKLGDKIVLVYVTAKWCFSCVINDNFVWQSDPLIDFLDANKVTMMRADLSRPNKEISLWMSQNGAIAVPFSIIFAPAKRQGTVLPIILTPSIVIDAIAKLSSSS